MARGIPGRRIKKELEDYAEEIRKRDKEYFKELNKDPKEQIEELRKLGKIIKD